MKARYQFIYFTESAYAGHLIWICRDNKDRSELGRCHFYRDWHQWVFVQTGSQVVFSAGCLRDIADFMDQLRLNPNAKGV